MNQSPALTAEGQASDVVISAQQLSKVYHLYQRPQDRLKDFFLRRFGKQVGREFWALKQVSFEVRRGETVGIIGRNGSGKSTLLQLIAGVLAPTAGTVQAAGRVAALLELGSGFNPEYTGRENVFLNGSILGLSHGEIAARFDEIAAFADIGEFIDQPVKTYSSGMLLRLAFAVQAAVPKEILIIDEALAVGDEAFQRKCMRTLEQFQEAGGTILLVTHNAQTIVRQCSRCLFLHEGQLILDGPSKPVTDVYQRFIYGTSHQQQALLAVLSEHKLEALPDILSDPPASTLENRPINTSVSVSATFDPGLPKTTEIVYGSGQAEIFDCGMQDEYGRQVNVLVAGRQYTWHYRVRLFEPAWNLNFGMMLRTVDGIAVVGINTESEGYHFPPADAGCMFEVGFELQMNLATGTYYMESGVVGETETGTGEGGFLHRRLDICAFRILPPDSRPIYGLTYVQPRIEVQWR